MSSGSTSSYGDRPLVIISHNTTPNDHCENNNDDDRSFYIKLCKLKHAAAEQCNDRLVN